MITFKQFLLEDDSERLPQHEIDKIQKQRYGKYHDTEVPEYTMSQKIHSGHMIMHPQYYTHDQHKDKRQYHLVHSDHHSFEANDNPHEDHEKHIKHHDDRIKQFDDIIKNKKYKKG